MVAVPGERTYERFHEQVGKARVREIVGYAVALLFTDTPENRRFVMELTPEKVARTGAFLYDTNDDDGQWDVDIDVVLTLDDVVGPTYEDALAVWEAQSAR